MDADGFVPRGDAEEADPDPGSLSGIFEVLEIEDDDTAGERGRRR